VNWDMAQYPSFPERPDTYGMIKPSVLSVATTSKHKDEALQVIDLVVSHDVQLIYSRMGVISPLKDPEMRKQFGADLPFLQGKHVEAAFKSKPAPYVRQSLYSDKGQSILNKKFAQLNAGKDINTVLREIDEEIVKHIESVKIN